MFFEPIVLFMSIYLTFVYSLLCTFVLPWELRRAGR